MNNFVNFLLEYYVWILVVLGIIIVTIIGFLVDSKQKRKKKEKVLQGASEVKTVEPLNELNTPNSVPVVDAKTQVAPVSNNDLGQTTVNSNVAQTLSNTQPVVPNNVNEPVNNSEKIQTLSEQKPHFEPREANIPNPTNLQPNSISNVVAPKPVSAVSINQQPVMPTNQVSVQPNNQISTNPVVNQPVSSPMYGQVSNVAPTNVSSVQPLNNQPSIQPVTANNGVVNDQGVSSYNSVNPTIQNTGNYNNIGVSNQSVNPNILNQTITAIPTPAPTKTVSVSPIPAPNPTPVVPVQENTNQPQVTTPSIGISFVTGDTQNSNPNEDMWKL